MYHSFPLSFGNKSVIILLVTDASLSEYIDGSRKLGIADSDIRQTLITAGWPESTVNSALGLAPTPPDPSAVAYSQPGSFWSWDSFEHILLFLSLYTLLASIGAALNRFADQLFPLVKAETNQVSFYASNYLDNFYTGVLSALIVSLPLFAFFFLNILKRTIKNPLLRHNLARKRLIYTTLIVTFIIMVSNLIGIVNGFLNGNLVANSLAHFVATVGLCAIVFAYYLNLIWEDKNEKL